MGLAAAAPLADSTASYSVTASRLVLMLKRVSSFPQDSVAS
jgi:hypothetical protein